MPILKRKNPFCLNCNNKLLETDNYCAACGQENNDRMVSFWDLVKEVFGNIFSYDSQFIRSIVPFLFKPGYLTNQFLAGKRKTYIQPIRLYFATSFLFFLIYSNQINFKNTDFGKNLNLNQLKDSSIKKPEEKTDFLIQTDSIKVGKIKQLNISGKQVESRKKRPINKKDFFQNFFNEENQKLIKDQKLSPDQLLDTLKIEKTFLNKLFAKQSIKIVNEGGTQEFLNYAIGKLPIMMFILMPIVALILKILYIGSFSRLFYYTRYLYNLLFHVSQKTIYRAAKNARLNIGITDPKQSEMLSFTYPRRYYIEHLTFTLHLHAFFFFCFVLIGLFLKIGMKPISIGFTWLAGLWMIVYMWVSFKKVYRENFFKTFFKINALLIAYLSSLIVCFLFLLLISLMLF